MLRLLAPLVATALAATGVAMVMSPASAQVSGSATGYATQNGGTTGGAGGQTVRATTGTEINAALCNRASASTPIIIEVEGTINHGNTSDVSGDSCDVTDDVIDLKRVSNITIVGVGSGAVFDQLGIHIREASNIILQNLTIRNVKKSGSPTSNGGDAIGMETDVRNVWADHLTLEASGGEDEGFDGLFDMKDNTRYVTLSYSILRNSGRGGLIGSSSGDTENGFITFHHNLYSNIDSRTPLLRGGIAHMYNNHYVGLVKSGINSRVGAQAKVDNNYFQDSKDVLGTFYTNDFGTWDVSGNIYDNVAWSSDGDENHPAGPDPQSTTSVSIPYPYDLDGASCVPDIVSQTAGADHGLQVSDGDCTPQSPSPTPTPTPTSTPTPTPTCSPTPIDPGGTNLSIGAGSDGSSKASGTSYGNVRDGDMDTYWSPSGSTGRISIKWDSDPTVSAVNIREEAGAVGNIGSWRLYDHDTDATLATGSGAGMINFDAISLRKISFEITSSNGTPRVAEFETYGGSTTPPDCDPTDPPPPPPPTDPARYEAEDAPAACDGPIDSNHSGFSGSGFCNTDNELGNASTFVIGTNEAGSATVGIRYANGTSQNRTADISVNGNVAVSNHSFPGTGAWNSWAITTVVLPLVAGSNTVALTATTGDGLGNIDYIEIEGGSTTPPPPPGGTLFVAPNGSDSASGSESDPTTLTAAIDRVEAGGRISMRGGTYDFSETVHIVPGNDGSSGNRKELFAYPGETPVLNFSGQSEDSANRGLAIGGDWWHLRGIIVEHAGDNGILLGGNDNIIERVVTRFNHDTGLQLSRYTAGAPRSEWPSRNLVISSESHDNADSDGEDADGFAPKLTVGEGNVLRYTVSHNNIDDGYDLYTKDDTGAIGAVTIESSLAYGNGTLSDGSQSGNGDRNGFKLGGEDIGVDHVVEGNIAYENGKHGFTYNRNLGTMQVTGNVSVDNEERNFNFDGGSSVFGNNTSCYFDSGLETNDRIIGNSDSSNQFWSGSNGSRCSSYTGSLDWHFAADGALVVNFGGNQVMP